MIELFGVLHLLGLIVLSAAASLKLSTSLKEALTTSFFLVWGNLILSALFMAAVRQLDSPFIYGLFSLFLQALPLYFLRKRKPFRIPGYRNIRLGKKEKLLVGALLGLALLNALVAFGFPPNNWDSLTYHLPRIHFYLSQSHLGHFFTTNPRQIYFPFNATLFQLPVVLYALPDRLFHFINLAAWITSGVLVYNISMLLFKNRKAALLSVFLGLTGTSVLAQAATTNNDLLLAVAVLGAVLYIFKWIKYRSPQDVVFAGIAAGIAVGVKVTIAYFIPGLMVFLVLRYWSWSRIKSHFQQYMRGKKGQHFLWACMFCVVLGSPAYLINLAEKGSLVPEGQNKYVNQPWSMKVARQNIASMGIEATMTPPVQLAYHTFSLYDTYRHTAYKHTFAYYLNHYLYKYWRSRYWEEERLARFENYRKKFISKNPVEDEVWYGFSFYAVAFGFVILAVKKYYNPFILFIGLLVISFILSYGILMSWQPWACRFFHAPYILAVVPAGAGINNFLYRQKRLVKKILTYGFYAIIVVYSVAYILNNQRRGLLYINQSKQQKEQTAFPEKLKDLSQYNHVCIVRINKYGNNQRLYPLMRGNGHTHFYQSPKPKPHAYNIVAFADSNQFLKSQHKLRNKNIRYIGKGQGIWFEIINPAE